MTAVMDCSAFVRRLDNGRSAMEIAVEDIKCGACVSAIERGLRSEPGVAAARVNLALKRVTVEWEDNRLEAPRVLERLDEIGFRGHPFTASGQTSAEARATAHLLRCLGVAAFGAMNIMLLSVSVWSGNVSDITPETRDFFHWMSALIAIPTCAYAGRPFFDSALSALRHRSVNMDVPITLGVLLALGMSVAQTLRHAEHAYFDSAVMLIFFLLIGRTLDQMMRRRARDLAANIATLRAETATRLDDDGATTIVPIGAVQPGDRVLVQPGERVSVDGAVLEGRSHVDLSIITGETNPVAVAPDARVYAGAMNLEGALVLRVDAARQGTLLDEIERLLDHANAISSAYVRLADRAAQLYAPLVHATALATFLGWLAFGLAWPEALIIAITVLIITCPCAMGLAIPAVQVVASGALFRSNVLLRSGDAIERFAECDTVIFDKTGTLTLPDPELIGESGDAEGAALALRIDAARLALSSRHPLAAALARGLLAHLPKERYPQAHTPFAEVVEEAGQGMRATLDGEELRLGDAAFCDAAPMADEVARRFPQASLMAFRRGDAAHVFAVGQRLRPDARRVVDELRARGLAIEILSGDQHGAVSAVARELGVEAFVARATPASKIARLDELRAAGRKALMVGDGLNDAPALAAAHASLSPTSASHLSQTAADALFLGQSLRPVARVFLVSRKARALMIENLWFSVGYNFIAVPLAIAGFVTPLIAAAAMSGSSILVTLNALRARAGEAEEASS